MTKIGRIRVLIYLRKYEQTFGLAPLNGFGRRFAFNGNPYYRDLQKSKIFLSESVQRLLKNRKGRYIMRPKFIDGSRRER